MAARSIPLDVAAQARVKAETDHYFQRATTHYQRRFALVPVVFDLTGQAAGMYCTRGRQRWIRYNPYLFAKNLANHLAETVPHEVAHCIVDQLHGPRRVRPHGPEWQAVMHAFDVPPDRCHHDDLAGVPVRRQHRYAYGCACATPHRLSATRHNRVRRGVEYRCTRCGQSLKSLGKTPSRAP